MKCKVASSYTGLHEKNKIFSKGATWSFNNFNFKTMAIANNSPQEISPSKKMLRLVSLRSK